MPETAKGQAPDTWTPQEGDIVIDLSRGSTAEFWGTDRGHHWLRPLGGGREWQSDHIRPATQPEVIQARLSFQNARSSR
jgi:hypothetical protein